MTSFAFTHHTITTRGRHTHRRAQGICTVCGSTWPRWGAQINEAQVSALRAGFSLGLPRC